MISIRVLFHIEIFFKSLSTFITRKWLCLVEVWDGMLRLVCTRKCTGYLHAGHKVNASKKLVQAMEHYDEHKRPLAHLSMGDSLQAQNREDNHPIRWYNNGQIMERLEHGQYLVKYDGSGQVLLRTRGHLKKVAPCTRSHGWPELIG